MYSGYIYYIRTFFVIFYVKLQSLLRFVLFNKMVLLKELSKACAFRSSFAQSFNFVYDGFVTGGGGRVGGNVAAHVTCCLAHVRKLKM